MSMHAAVAAGLLAVTTAGVPASASAAPTVPAAATATPAVCAAKAAAPARCLLIRAGAPAGVRPDALPPGLGPKDIERAYRLPVGNPGQLVAVVSAYNDPT